MSLQRGTYGIEYDERQSSPLRKFWGVFALVPLAAVFLLLARGCRGERDDAVSDGASVGQTRYRAPEVTATRERASLLKHFFNIRLKPVSGASAPKTADAAESGQDSGWLASEARPAPAAKVQSPEVKKLLDQAAAREEEDDLLGARLLLLQVLIRRDADDVRAFVERKIGSLNTTLVFDNRPMPEKGKHRIVAGDVIGKLAKRYGNTQDFILRANGIDKPELLRIGREVWVLQGPVFELTVFKKGGSAVLTLNGQFFKRYPVGIGKPELVPVGTYAVRGKVKRTAARPAGDDAGREPDQLGTRWMTLAATGATPEVKGFGLHGTWNESSLGRPSDSGRVRFRNADIEELCTLLPDGAAVNIAE